MLKTERLLIRPYKREDEAAVYRIVNSEKIYKTTLNIPYPYPREQLPVWIHFTLKNILYKRGYEFGIFHRTEGYIGNIGIVNIDRSNNNAEITYFIGESHWGKGYATEASYAALDFAFNELKMERIQGRCLVNNPASLRVMYRCGFTYEGRARHEVIKEGQYQDVWHAAILKQDGYEQKGKNMEWPRELFNR